MHRARSYQAAWVRWADRVGHGDGRMLAERWIVASAARHGVAPILLTATKVPAGADEWVDVLRSGHNATVRSPGRARGPVLVAGPTWKMLELAQRLADGFALCALEYPDYPLVGWARQNGAVELSSGRVAEPYETDQAQTLEHLAFEGYKGYGDDTSKRMARHYLTDLAREGLADRATVLGALCARGVSTHGLDNLARLGPARATATSSWHSRRW